MMNLAPSDNNLVASPPLVASPELTATAVLPEPFGSGRPMSAEERSKLLDRVYDEFCDLRAAGVDVDPEDYCARYPNLEVSLRKLFVAHNEVSGDLETVRHAARSWPQPNEEFLEYSLLSELGRGTFARVFLAREMNLGGRLVALKLTLHETTEPATLGKLQHPGVVPVYSTRYDVATGFTIVVMPFLGGCTFCHVLDYLRALRGGGQPRRASVLLDAARDERWSADGAPPADPMLRRGGFLEGVLHIGAAMADALASVHAQGFLHRDLKPSNVLLTPCGRPVLLDFNLAHNQEVADYRLCGTLPYMPPEQLSPTVAGRRQPDPPDGRRDLFGLSVMLYELLAGKHPFGSVPASLKSPEIREYLLKQQRRGPKSLRLKDRTIDPALDRLLLRCLAWDPDVRPASAAEFAAELRSLLSPTRRLRRWVKRHEWALAVATVITAVPAAYGVHKVATMPSAAQTGEEHYRESRYDDAIKAFTASLDADPQQPEVLFMRGRAYMKAGNYKKALEDLRDPSLADHPRALATCGYLYSRDEKTDHTAAIEYYKSAMDRGFVNAYLLNDMAYSYQRSGGHQEAVDYATKALKRDAGLRPALYNRAIARLILAEKKLVPDLTLGLDDTPGLDDIRQVLARGPLSAMDYWWAGKIATRMIVDRDDLKAQILPVAIEYFRKAIEKGCRQRLEVDQDVTAIAELLPAIAGAQPLEFDQGPPPFQSRLVDPLQGTPD
jgi:serine/threonine protein kinase